MFKFKRLPNGISLKYKTRFCVRTNLQSAEVDYFEIYTPLSQ